jgi:hypothetical protein
VSTNRLEAPVLAFVNSKAKTARITARKVDVAANREGGREGAAITNAYDPSDSLGRYLKSCCQEYKGRILTQ